jgi:hypothetical protein
LPYTDTITVPFKIIKKKRTGILLDWLPYINTIYHPQNTSLPVPVPYQKLADFTIRLDFEEDEMTETRLRELFKREILLIHPEVFF